MASISATEWLQPATPGLNLSIEMKPPVPFIDRCEVHLPQTSPGLRQERGPNLPSPLPMLYKDFYLCHPAESLQCPEFCWGNLEAAHPVLGKRTPDEAEQYRQENGIQVEVIRGRPAPRPFQSFKETSFPPFVEELAYELFTKDAIPFPIQAQAWPCILSGMDIVAVAPTGSGKTLAFLLPALVHVMAQDPLEEGEGPIVLVLEKTRELVEQTLAMAQRFCERTHGEDKLRVGAAYGGVDVSLQLPLEDAPDNGRWPEILVSTPGRFLDLLVKGRRINTRRVSYVVLDEADQLLTPVGLFPQLRAILSHIRPERQLLMLSATWSAEDQALAEDLSGKELVKINVHPEVPRIPQTVHLFTDANGDDSFQARRAALIQWLQTELRPGEAVLIFCMKDNTARELAADNKVIAAVTADSSTNLVALLVGSPTDERSSAYARFVRGESRVLVSTFAMGSRGLDYSDATSLSVGKPAISLAVFLFDFPQHIKDYIHCIGRADRPAQQAGRAIAFLPEMRFWIAKELRIVLEKSGQQLPPELNTLIESDLQFLASCRSAMLQLQAAEPNKQNLTVSDGVTSGDLDVSGGIWILPAMLPSYRRKLLHFLADEFGLFHVSSGTSPSGRRLHISRDRNLLPDRCFLLGEAVWAPPHQGAKSIRGTVADPRVHKVFRTIHIRFHRGSVSEVPVDFVQVCVEDR